MNALGISHGYQTGKVFIIWEIPHDGITHYEIYRDGNKIASSLENEDAEFVSPTTFDHDHHTNLFKKDSTFKLMYTDEAVKRYQQYEYKVTALRVDENGQILETIESNPVFIAAQ